MPASFVAFFQCVTNSWEGGGGVGVAVCFGEGRANLSRRAAPRSDWTEPAIFFGWRLCVDSRPEICTDFRATAGIKQGVESAVEGCKYFSCSYKCEGTVATGWRRIKSVQYDVRPIPVKDSSERFQ